MSVNRSATRVVVFFDRLGPYHFSRLQAASREMQITAVESSNEDPINSWEEVRTSGDFDRVLLFRDEPLAQQHRSVIEARVRGVLSELHPDAVAIPGWSDPCALAALAWCLEQGIPAVVMSESTPWDHKRIWWKEAIKRQVLRCFGAGLVGGTSHAEYLKSLGMAPERIFLGYDAVDNEYFSSKANEVRTGQPGNGHAGVRSKHALPQNYFLASARFVEKKNLLHLVEAYSRYRLLASPSALHGGEAVAAVDPATDGQPSSIWDLVILGDGLGRAKLESLISSLGLKASVHLPGFKQYSDLPVYYGCARAFVHASTTEEWGLVVNEAMASGLPVLVSNRCGCVAELVQEGRNGSAFAPGNVEQLAQLMQGLAKLPGHQLNAMGDASRDIISQWGPDRFATGLRLAVEKARAACRPRSGIASRVLLSALRNRGGHPLPPASAPTNPIQPAVARFFNRESSNYAGLFQRQKIGTNFIFGRRLELAREIGAAFSGSVLDCATGPGEISCEVLRAGDFQQATFVDISPEMLAACRRRVDEQLRGGKLELRLVNASVFEFAAAPDAGEYDLILCLGLIAHTGRLTELLRLLAARLKPGGSVLLQSTLLDHWGARLVRAMSAERYRQQHGYRMTWFTRADIVASAAEAGLKIVREKRFAVGLPFADRIWARANYELEERCQNWASRHGSEALFLLQRGD